VRSRIQKGKHRKKSGYTFNKLLAKQYNLNAEKTYI